jgi:hypothetical protein
MLGQINTLTTIPGVADAMHMIDHIIMKRPIRQKERMSIVRREGFERQRSALNVDGDDAVAGSEGFHGKRCWLVV